MQELTEVGLRQRKRCATQSIIENTAAALVTEHGYSGVTVDMICANSNISLRTFFNYFPSKATAVGGLGIRLPHPARVLELLEENSPDVFAGLIAVLEVSVSLFDVETELAESRRALVAGTPELYQLHFVAVDRMQSELLGCVRARFSAHPDERRLADQVDVGEEARLTVMLAIDTIRFSLHQWIGNERHIPRSGSLRETVDLLARIATR